MTYEQCYLQSQELKNFISPFNCEMIIFDFYTATEFNVIFLEKSDYDLSREIACRNRQLDRSHVCICDDQYGKVFNYANPTVVFEYDLNTDEMTDCYSFEGHHPPNSILIRLEMIKLKELLLSGKPLDEEDGISN